MNSQWPTFLQTLFSIADQRPKTVVILTLPTEQDANRKLTGELKQHIPTVLETVGELESTTAAQARNLTPTQSNERAAVLGRRLFERIDHSQPRGRGRFRATTRNNGRPACGSTPGVSSLSTLNSSALGYPFHPELIRLFSERLADIHDFQATRSALRLVARTIRAVWERKAEIKDTLLLQPSACGPLTWRDARRSLGPSRPFSVRARPRGRRRASRWRDPRQSG